MQRAVHHAHDAFDLVAGQALGQRLDHRDAAGDGGFKADHAACGLGGQRKGLAVVGQQGLVGGDDVLAGGDGGFGGQFGGAFVAAHHLDEHVDIVALGQRHRDRFPRHRPTGRRRGFWIRSRAETAVICTGASGAAGDQIGVLLDDLDHADADGAKTSETKRRGLADMGELRFDWACAGC